MEGVRRRLTLSEQMSILDSSNLRDLLRVRDDDIDDGRNALAGLTLGAVLGCEEIIRPNNHHQPSRTLLDIIKDEESGAAYRGIDVVVDNTQNGINNNNKQKSWKSFKDRLRLRRAGAAWSSSSSSHHHHHPISDDCDDDDDDCRLEISGPTLTGIQRSSFSLVPSRSSVPVQNVTDFDERETSTVVEEEEEINTGTGGSSSDLITVTNNSVPSEPVVMRLSAALAAEREEQRQQASQLEEERESTETQLVEERESIETQLGEERESPIEVAEQQEEDHQQQNHSRNEELGINQRGIGVISAGQQHQNQSRNEELVIDQRGVGLVISTGQQQQQNQSRNEEMGIDQRGVGVVSTGQQQQQPLRVSLMALLEETMDHRQNELILLDEEEEEMVGGGGGEDQVVGMMVERERGGKNDEYICCVCMVRHKGAAFIPCGHTFCRLCSRKLWVNRGNCPLCNGFILEILDIF